MPLLDVSFVVTDPMFADTFSVMRRAEVVGLDGRVTLTKTAFPNLVGTVLPVDPTKVERRDDGQVVEHAIEIHAPFVFREVSQGFQPDEITWRGRTYFLDKLLPFSHFGSGYQAVLCISVKATDANQF